MTELIPIAARRLRRHLRPPLVWASAWVATFVLFELLGRSSSTDSSDGIAVALLVALVLGTALGHQRRPLPWLAPWLAFARRVGERLASNRVRLGVDLRREPPLPEALPAPLAWAGPLGFVALALAAWTAPHMPGGAREAVLAVSPSVWFVLLGALWLVLAGAALVLLCAPVAFAAEIAAARGAQGGWVGAGVAAYALAILVAVVLLPPWVPLAGLAAALLACGAAALPARPSLVFLWRGVAEDAPARSIRWSRLALAGAWSYVAVAGTLVLVSAGQRTSGDVDPTIGITALLGVFFGWTAFGALSIVAFDVVQAAFLARWRNPASPRERRVALARPVPPAELETWAREFAASGFTLVREGEPRRPTDVPVELEAPEAVGAARQRLSRRADILCRRRFRRGLKRLFKEARAERWGEGTGWWLGPQHWFVTRMGRDGQEDDRWIDGPPLHPTIPLEARRHLHEVLEGTAIDLVFVEDGVGFRRLWRVLAMLFEFYDLFGPGRPAEERHFRGLPGVRVVLHEFEIGAPYRSSRYPEPEYEGLGRGRVLHVFVDRGGHVDEATQPADFDARPRPLVLGPA